MMQQCVFAVGCIRWAATYGRHVSKFTFARQRVTGPKLVIAIAPTKPKLNARQYNGDNVIFKRLFEWETNSVRKYLSRIVKWNRCRFRSVAAVGSWVLLGGQGGLLLGLRGFSLGISPIAPFNNRSGPRSEPKVDNDRNIVIRLLWLVWETFRMLLRALRLFVTFFPLLCLYPVTCLSFRIRQLWWWFLLWAIESSGPVFIKLGQWASTRRDLFSPEFCDQFSRLQRSVQPHSWHFTCKRLDYAFGDDWRQFLVRFDDERRPIGSGCVAQVYKAYLRVGRLPEPHSSTGRIEVASKWRGITHKIQEGLEHLGILSSDLTKKAEMDKMALTEDETLVPVAVKVMHPGIHDAFRRDLFIMLTFVSVSEAIVPGLHWLNLSRCMEEFASVMKKQMDLSLEAKNLELFASDFRNVPSIVFPVPIRPLVTEHVLVETYEEGAPMLNFTKNGPYSDELKAKLADIGIDAVFRMVFGNNFVHGDLHPGNILVQNADKHDGDSPKLRTTDLMDTVVLNVKQSPPLRLVFLDCGITATLGERDLDNMFSVFTAVIRGNGEEVGDLFLKHTRDHKCRNEDGFRRDMARIVMQFKDEQKNLEPVNVSSVISDLFGTLIRYKVQLEGNFAMVILAMMIIEGLGHSLKPSLDILEKARPFLMARHKREMNDLQNPF